IEAEASKSFEHVIVHTGQHYDPLFSDVFFEQLKIPLPTYNLEVHGGDRDEVIARTEEKLLELFPTLKPDCILVYGDVNGAVGAAQASKKCGIRLAHIEAGLRSFDQEMPEELNRVRIDELADFLFCTEQSGMDHLTEEKAKGEAYLVGNAMIDTLVRMMPLIAKDKLPDNIPEKFGVVTLHRPSNVDNKQALESVLSFLLAVSKRCPLVFPVHHRFQNALSQFGMLDFLESPQAGTPASAKKEQSRLQLLSPLPYLQFLKLVQNAEFILTDSGGIQEEATYLKKKCFTLRRNTERPSTIESGSNTLIDEMLEGDQEKVFSFAQHPVQPSVTVPPLWDGKAGERILKELRAQLS
ncbi:UDP-N-acetylglucosamine 2-epimerase (non-hydrolyzing), partial [Candidatus Peregrinibacteria bacterium]|nr:UDP-N-acetylglucosamine 2-epimerase (non-hydrolyzing) [Candidatus Peregrinibacteria bacterium]